MSVPMIRMSLVGDKQVMKRLSGIIPRLRKKALTKSARVAMKPLLASAKANAPKEGGSLKKSIKLRAIKKNRRGVVGVYVATSDGGMFKGDQYYGAFQEFGWASGHRRASTEWKKNAESVKWLQARGVKIKDIEPDGSGWVPAWKKGRKPKEIEARVNRTSMKRASRRRDIPGKHFIERAYLTGREAASGTFVTELGNQLDEIAKGG